jgi:hypothetical protein
MCMFGAKLSTIGSLCALQLSSQHMGCKAILHLREAMTSTPAVKVGLHSCHYQIVLGRDMLLTMALIIYAV